MNEDEIRAEVARLGKRRQDRKRLLDRDTSALRDAILSAVEMGLSENELTSIGKVDRMTIRTWLGKR